MIMKTLIVSLFVLPSLLAQPAGGGIDDISRALAQGDVAVLSNYFDIEVELSILDEEDTYDKTDATAMVRSFFGDNAPRGFTQVHQGVSRGSEAEYCIGDLTTSSGNFRVYIYLANVGNKQVIQELRFDRE